MSLSCVLPIFILLMFSCNISSSWQDEAGLIITDGIASHALQDGKGILVSQTGHQRVTDTELVPISVYHALVLVSDPFWEPQGSEVSRFQAETLNRLNWISKDGEKKVQNIELKFNGKDRYLLVGGQKFPLLESNTFIIRISANWTVTTQQLRGVNINERLEMPEVLEKMKMASESPEIFGLKLSN